MAHRNTPAAARTPALAMRLAPLAMLGLLTGAGALAQDPSYYYVGLGVGQTRGTLDTQRISDSVAAPIVGAFTSQSLGGDRRDVGYKVFAGYQMNPWLGVELGYFDLGKQRLTNTTAPAGTLAGELRSRGANLDLVGTLPVRGKLSALARVGVAYARTQARFSGTGAVSVTNPTPSDRSANLKLGVGLQYALNDAVLLRGEAERYRNSDAVVNRGHVNLFSASLVVPFGRAPASTRRSAATAPMMVAAAPVPAAMPAPAPVVATVPLPAPVAAPLVAAMPEPAALRRVSYSAESLFGFDVAAVQPAGRAALDAFSAALAGVRDVDVQVEGHTDRLGGTAYNQALSQQRADAVKAYLVTQGKLDPARVQATGKGEGSPVTQPGTCDDKGQRSALIACLQPDRRVEIAVSGNR